MYAAIFAAVAMGWTRGVLCIAHSADVDSPVLRLSCVHSPVTTTCSGCGWSKQVECSQYSAAATVPLSLATHRLTCRTPPPLPSPLLLLLCCVPLMPCSDIGYHRLLLMSLIKRLVVGVDIDSTVTRTSVYVTSVCVTSVNVTSVVVTNVFL